PASRSLLDRDAPAILAGVLEAHAHRARPGNVTQALRPLHREDTARPGQLLEAELPLVAVAAQPIEVGVVEAEATVVAGQQHERGTRYLVVGDAEAAGETADERRLPRPQLAGEQHHFPAREGRGEAGREFRGLGFARRQVVADVRPPASGWAS